MPSLYEFLEEVRPSSAGRVDFDRIAARGVRRRHAARAGAAALVLGVLALVAVPLTRPTPSIDIGPVSPGGTLGDPQVADHPVSLSSLQVNAVGLQSPQTWTFVSGESGGATTWEGSFTRDPMPPGNVGQWFTDGAGGVLVGRNGYTADQSGLDRLTPDGDVSEVLPSDPQLFSKLVGVGNVAETPVAVMAELDLGEDRWRVAAYDLRSGHAVTWSTQNMGASVDRDVTAAAVHDTTLIYATSRNPMSSGLDDVETQLMVEVPDGRSTAWTSEDRIVTGLVAVAEGGGVRTYALTVAANIARESTYDPAPVLLVLDGTRVVSEFAIPGAWGPVDEDWIHVPTRVSRSGGYLMVSGETVPAEPGLVDASQAPLSPVWVLDPSLERWMALDVQGSWALRGSSAL